jgi:hypothetical protein
VGDLRVVGKSLTLKCGHPIYLPTLSKGQRFEAPVAAPTATPTPASVPPSEESNAAPKPPTPGTNPATVPQSKKSDTQKISTI